jgi:hypothetical protein
LLYSGFQTIIFSRFGATLAWRFSRFASGTCLIYRTCFGLSTTFSNYFGICFFVLSEILVRQGL